MMVMIGFGFVVAYLFLIDKPKSRDLGILLIAFYIIYMASLAFMESAPITG